MLLLLVCDAVFTVVDGVVVFVFFYLLFFVLICCRCLCLLFVQRQSSTMTEFLLAMTQLVQKELGDRRSLETHR